MLCLPFAALVLAASMVSGAPLTKRIAQVIADSTAKWEQACLAAGGADKCNPLSITAFSTLLAAPGPCEQQDAADQMIDLAKALNNDPTMIALTQIFAQQPRNTPNSLSVPYCQTAPKNTELNGLFQCQFQGADLKNFVGGATVGQPGTIPFGRTTPVSPAGSCPANPSGPVAAGAQLVDSTQNPGVGGANNSAPAKATGVASATASATAPTSTHTDCDKMPASAPTLAAPPAASSAAPPAAAVAPSGSFTVQNGKDAQALNAKFATLTASSSCTEGENACVGAMFAQCVGGKFVTTSCGAAPLTCAALPLVNSRGTSVTCTTRADAEARIAAAGASGGFSG